MPVVNCGEGVKGEVLGPVAGATQLAVGVVSLANGSRIANREWGIDSMQDVVPLSIAAPSLRRTVNVCVGKVDLGRRIGGSHGSMGRSIGLTYEKHSCRWGSNRYCKRHCQIQQGDLYGARQKAHSSGAPQESTGIRGRGRPQHRNTHYFVRMSLFKILQP